MLIGLCGQTDLFDMRRESTAQAFGKHVFYFDELTCELCKRLPVAGPKGATYFDYLREGDRVGILYLKQKVEEGIRAVNPKFYTDWMTQQLVNTVFRQGLQVSAKVTEAVIVGIKYPEQARWFTTFGVGKANRPNKLIEVMGAPELPPYLASHESENYYKEFDISKRLDVNEFLRNPTALASEVNKIRKSLYLE